MGQLPIEVAGAASVCAELFLYGVFTCLFIETVYISIKKRRSQTRPSQIFFFGSWVMFIVATTHITLNVYRLLRGYVFLRNTVGPDSYFADLGRWDNIAHDATNAIMTWLGDGLAIYRCYLIWDTIYVVILPICLMAVSIVSNSVALHLFTEVSLGSIFSPTLVHWMNTLYSVALVQNVITTGLIAYHIYGHERRNRQHGVVSWSLTPSAGLIPLVRIIVESAMGYTAILIVLIVLYALDNNGQYIMQECSVPAVGIVFTLISVRLAMHSSRALKTSTAPNSTLAWAGHNTTSTDVSTNTGSTGTSRMHQPYHFFAPLMDLLDIATPHLSCKRICIIGAGAGGLAVLKAILDTPQHKSGSWDVTVYEARDDIGGIWLPSPTVSHTLLQDIKHKDAKLPLTPLYDSLTTNLPHPIMSFNSLLFPPSTPIFPEARVVQTYLKDYASNFNLLPYICLNTSVENVSRDPTNSHWSVKLSSNEERPYDNVVVANGHYRVPRYPNTPGVELWLKDGRAMHSVCGRDISTEMASIPSTKTLIRSISGAPNEDLPPSVHDGKPTGALVNQKQRGRVASYESGGKVVFQDGSVEEDVDFVILATGYELDFPFFSEDVLQQMYPPPIPPIPQGLYNSTSHVFPLAKHLFPLTSPTSTSPTYPPESLSFICLLMRVIPFPLMEAQAKAIVHVFSNPESLNQPMEAVDIVARYEDLLAAFQKSGNASSDSELQRYIAKNWHVLADLVQFDYRDELHRFASGNSTEPSEEGSKSVVVVPEWVKRMYMKKDVLRRVWVELENKGDAGDWVKGVGEGASKEEAAKQWVGVLERMLQYADDTHGANIAKL
ncbi:hypothetical protein ONZ45_g1112 [Pleurotus djamor]|nr:hypothetical protein ONZ45_g1112 [Pleurotus djamor]